MTQVIDARATGINSVAARAASVMGDGGLVIIPTDTVYGLAGRADSDEAIGRLFSLKGRARNNPLPVLLPSAECLSEAGSAVPRAAVILADRFWPGPLTIVVPKVDVISDSVTAGLGTVGLRVPDHRIALAVLSECGFFVAATSANVSSERPARGCEDIEEAIRLGADLIVAAGSCSGGEPSTVVDATASPACILRQGPISSREIEVAIENGR